MEATEKQTENDFDFISGKYLNVANSIDEMIL